MVIEIPGLNVEGDTPAQRRAHFKGLTAADKCALVSEMVSPLRDAGPDAFEPLAKAVSLPLGEVVASPWALRACAMAAQIGAFANHHELRSLLTWPERALPEIEEPEHGRWEHGVLRVGKYQSFQLEEPLSPFNPNHMSKWGPHELMHRVCRFFWRHGMRPWDLYLGSRLNELVPVVLWYGLDEVLRLDRIGFDRARDTAQPNADLDRARWLRCGADELAALLKDTVHFFDLGLDHLEGEFAAVVAERADGVPRVVHNDAVPVLNASSDSTAYVVGHFARLTSAPTTDLMTRVLTAGRDYFVDIEVYQQHVEHSADELCFQALTVNLETGGALRTGRALWDLINRTATAGMSLDPNALAQCRAAFDSTFDGVRLDMAEWGQFMASVVPDDAKTGWEVLLPGFAEAWDLEQLIEGLYQVAELTLTVLDGAGILDDILDNFVRSRGFWTRAPLGRRFANYIESVGVEPAWIFDLVMFEVALSRVVKHDDTVERLFTPVESLPKTLAVGEVLINTAFCLLATSYDIAPVHADFYHGAEELPEPAPAETLYLIGRYFADVAVLTLDDDAAQIWSACSTTVAVPVSDLPPHDDGVLRELVSVGALGWRPFSSLNKRLARD